MNEQQHHPQPTHRFATAGPDTEGASTGLGVGGLSTEGLSTEDLDLEREELNRAWAEFSRVRASVAEVMSDDELRDLGINVEALDDRP